MKHSRKVSKGASSMATIMPSSERKVPEVSRSTPIRLNMAQYTNLNFVIKEGNAIL